MKSFLTILIPLFLCNLVLAHDHHVSELIKQLELKGDASHKAADALANFPQEADHSVPALIEALGRDDAVLRWHVARTLSQFGEDSAPAAKALTKALADSDTKVQAYSAYALGKMGDAGLIAVPELIKLMTDEDLIVRKAALKAITTLDTDPKVTLPLLVKALEDAEPSVIVPVLNELAEAGEQSLPRLIMALESEKAAYWACLIAAEMGPNAAPAVPALIKVLDHPEADTRLQATIALGEIGPAAKQAAEKLSKVLHEDESTAVHYGAAFAIGSIGEKSAIEALQKVANSDDAFLKMITTWAIAMLNKDDKVAVKKAAMKLVMHLKHENANVRAAAARCLARLEAPQNIVAPLMIEAFKDNDPTVTANIRSAVVAYGEKAVPRVAKALEIEELQIHAIDILRQIGPAAKAAVPALTKVLGSNDPEIQEATLLALAAIGPEAAPAKMEVAKYLSSDNESLKQSALYALGNMGEGAADAKKMVLPLLESKEDFTQLAAAWTLAQIVPENADSANLAVPVLIKGLSDETAMVRMEAANALKKFGSHASPALDALEKAASDKDAEVSAAAQQAIKAIK